MLVHNDTFLEEISQKKTYPRENQRDESKSEQKSGDEASGIGGLITRKILYCAVKDHGQEKKSDPERESDKRVDEKRKNMTEVDPCAAGTERELITTDEETPFRLLMAADMLAAELHPECPSLELFDLVMIHIACVFCVFHIA